MKLTKATKYATIVLSILTASLVNEYVVKRVNLYYKEPTYLSVLIGMGVTVLIFVPLFGLLGKWITNASKAYLKTSKKVSSNSYRGLFVGFLLAFLILFVLYAKIRHGLDVLVFLKQYLK